MISGTIFYLLFLVVGLLLRLFLGVASLRNGAFRNSLKEKDFTMLVKTADCKKARYYRLEGGKLKSRSADYPHPDLSIIWSDSPSFVRTIFRLNPLQSAKGLTEAMTNGTLTIEADIAATMWFMSELGNMLGVCRSLFFRSQAV